MEDDKELATRLEAQHPYLDKAGLFKKGNKGGGRPKGSVGKKSIQAKRIIEQKMELLSNKLLEKAVAGEDKALMFALERVVPRALEMPITDYDLPPLIDLPTATQALADIGYALNNNELMPSQGVALTKVVEAFIGSYEKSDLEDKVNMMNEKLDKLINKQ